MYSIADLLQKEYGSIRCDNKYNPTSNLNVYTDSLKSSSPNIQSISNESVMLPPIYNFTFDNGLELPSLKQLFGDLIDVVQPKNNSEANILSNYHFNNNLNQHSTNLRITFISGSKRKRSRRKYHEIPRHFRCTYPNCNRAYGALNHLNAHIVKNNHGRKRKAKDYKINYSNFYC